LMDDFKVNTRDPTAVFFNEGLLWLSLREGKISVYVAGDESQPVEVEIEPETAKLAAEWLLKAAKA